MKIKKKSKWLMAGVCENFFDEVVESLTLMSEAEIHAYLVGRGATREDLAQHGATLELAVKLLTDLPFVFRDLHEQTHLKDWFHDRLSENQRTAIKSVRAQNHGLIVDGVYRAMLSDGPYTIGVERGRVTILGPVK